MAKLARLPDYGTIRALKKRVDFYDWRGIHVARSWPRKPRPPLGPAALQQQLWLQDAMLAYRKTSNILKGDLKWLTLGTSWTPRDAFMAFYFGTVPWPFERFHGTDPNKPPYPRPDPFSHYVAILAHTLWVYTDGHPWYQIDTTQIANWKFVFSYNKPTHSWLSRSRYGHVYPTTPYWSDNNPWFSIDPIYSFGTAHSFDLWQLQHPTDDRDVWFFFAVYPLPGYPPSKGFPLIFHLRLPPRGAYRPGDYGASGGPLHTHSPRLGFGHMWVVTSGLYPSINPRYVGTDYPRPPGVQHTPPY